MRLALLADLHANLHALQAVWQDVDRQRPDGVYCLGDLVGYGAFPNEVVGFVRERLIPTVMGNYDEGVGFDRDECGCAYRSLAERQRGDISLRWTRAQTTPDNKAFLRSLPRYIRLEGSMPNLLLVHGSPRRTNEYMYQDRPQALFQRLARTEGQGIIAFGHTHVPYAKKVQDTWFVNAGSVGRPRDGDPRAGYVIVTAEKEPQMEFRRVTYDAERAAQAVRAGGLPLAFADDLVSGGAAQGVAAEEISEKGTGE